MTWGKEWQFQPKFWTLPLTWICLPHCPPTTQVKLRRTALQRAWHGVGNVVFISWSLKVRTVKGRTVHMAGHWATKHTEGSDDFLAETGTWNLWIRCSSWGHTTRGFCKDWRVSCYLTPHDRRKTRGPCILLTIMTQNLLEEFYVQPSLYFHSYGYMVQLWERFTM